MNQAIHETTIAVRRDVDELAKPDEAAITRLAKLSRDLSPEINFVIHQNLESVEAKWRRFEQVADCTAFQTFDWLKTWHRHIGEAQGFLTSIAVGYFADGNIAMIAPLAIKPGRASRRLCWFGQELCDYNGPLLARDFSQRVTRDHFLALWQMLRDLIQRETNLRFDWIELEKMPCQIGTQINPFVHLPVTVNPSGAHITQLGDNWDKFYFDKRSSATRRRDRAKRRHMSQFGEVRFETCTTSEDTKQTLEELFRQKNRTFAQRGIPDIFQRPGFKEFFLDLATNQNLREKLHISRIEVGDNKFAATNFAIMMGDCYYHVLASYDNTTAVSHYGPGALHLRELLAYAIGRGLQRFDFTIGDEPYKLEWADRSIQLFDHSEAASWRGWPLNLSSLARRQTKRFIKQTPAVWRFVSYVRSRFRASARAVDVKQQSPTRAGADKADRPAACVMGDMDLLQPLVSADIPCTVVARPGVASLYSRHARKRLAWRDFSEDNEALLDALLRFSKSQPERPVLFCQEDAQVIFISRYRQQLAEAFRFMIPEATLVEDLVDKSRFAALARRLDLPVPASQQFHPVASEPEDLDLRFPVIIKPLTRSSRWVGIFGLNKAVEALDMQGLHTLWPKLIDVGLELLFQELIPGAEAQIESYHCYVDSKGSVCCDFTGRKIRTFPVSYGHTTALEITDTLDLRALGRDVVARLGLMGVAKLDFKRDQNGKLHLLEVNPRFTLWNNAAAVAGANIPALVYADLTGTPRPATARARPGVRWCKPWRDLPAALLSGVPITKWIRWTIHCEVKSLLSWRDPLPAVRFPLHRLLTRNGKPGSQTIQDWAGL